MLLLLFWFFYLKNSQVFMTVLWRWTLEEDKATDTEEGDDEAEVQHATTQKREFELLITIILLLPSSSSLVT